MTKIGIVTITFNSEKVIDGFLNSLNQQSFKDFELFVIDNNSQDKTIHKLNSSSLNFNFNLKINKTNIGVAAGNNQGVRMIIDKKIPNVLIMNNDVEFGQDLLKNIFNEHLNDVKSLITPKINYYKKDIIWYGGGFFKKNIGYKQYHRGFGEKSSSFCLEKEYVDYAPTCCLFVPCHVFSEVGFMDEKYFVYYDDVDFCYRILKSGNFKILFCPNIIIYHKVGSLTKSRIKEKLSDFFIKQNVRNKVYFIRKQKGFLKYIFLFFYFIEINLRFLLDSKYSKKISVLFLIYKSFFNGLRL